VEHDQLDEVARHARVVQGRVDPDQLVVVQVHAHLDRPPPPARTTAAPPDPRLQAPVEVLRIEPREDLAEIVDAPALGDVLLRPLRYDADQVAVVPDVVVDRAPVRASVPSSEPRQRPHHVVVRRREHVMQPEAHAALQALERHHGPGVVGQVHVHRLAEQASDALGEERCGGLWLRPCREGCGTVSRTGREEGELRRFHARLPL